MNSNDHPDLTAYALGELDAEHSEAMAHWVAEDAKAQTEANFITDLGEHLRQTAPKAELKLLAHQRAAILNGPQRVRQLVAAASQDAKRRQSRSMPVLWGIARFAAAAMLVFAGYLAGTHFHAKSTVAVTTPPPSPAPTKDKVDVAAQKPAVAPFRAKEVPAPTPAPVIAEALAPAAKPVAPAPAPAAKPEIKTLVASVPVALVSKEQPKPVLPHTKVFNQPFVTTSKTTLSQVTLRPSDTKFVAPAKAATAAAPINPNAKPVEANPRAKQPELLIHSWKADVASCPWNEAHRLIRLTIQIPGDQAAATLDHRYPLQVSFDPNYVRNFRQLSQRTVAATAPDAPAFHTVWYEFIPNGQATDAAREGAAKLIGSASLPNTRFTTAPTGPFDGSRLQIMDRGANWDAARDDFLFESAVAGFGLLLKGETNAGKLNHQVVLNLAQKALTADNKNAERAKFVKLVQDAGHAAGLQ